MPTDGEFLLGLLEQVGPQVGTSDSKVGRVLNRRPPVIRKKNPAANPVRNGLLAGLRLSELAKAGGETSLAPTNFDGTVESSKVSFIHNARGYTNSFVRVNNPICVTSNKSACMVDPMPTSRKSTVVPIRSRVTRAKKTPPKAQGADGKTLQQRLELAMVYKSGLVKQTYTEKDLIADANRIAQAPADDPLISQQSINAIRQGLVARSSFTPYLAEACGVRHLWLSNGTGKMV